MSTEYDRMMSPAEVATAWGVDPKTVTRWAKAGKLRSVMTPGGHRRYYESEIRSMLGYSPLQPPAGETR